PYGGGSAAVTGASLLLPTSVWADNYVMINGLPKSIGQPAANIIAQENDTTVTLLPVALVNGGGGIPSGPADFPLDIVLQAGEHAQLVQDSELTGSIIMSDKPVGLMGGHSGMQVPVGTPYSDHAEQMIPPIQALGHEYVGVMHRPRATEPGFWRVIGAVDGTVLSWSSDVGGPATLQQGEKVEFITPDPFVVSSQDEEHPFLLFNYMSGSQWVLGQPGLSNRGDSDYVISVPPDQYMPAYVFFADPTYPEGNLVLVRRAIDGVFYDVDLDCAGVLGGWQPVGEYEWTRFDLITGNFQDNGNCSVGRHEISSVAPFGMWVWGWGTTMTNPSTQNVSYGYPAGMNVQPINDVVIVPEG
ncbi:MAG: IgGFc-binding protein, partial [Myxococcales bacterium]|nr:IgGFc-binding protein [Myxococcales bacterium]